MREVLYFRRVGYWIRVEAKIRASANEYERTAIVGQDPFEMLAKTQSETLPWLDFLLWSREGSRLYPWWTELHHRLLIYVALLGYQHRDPILLGLDSEEMTQHLGYLNYALSEIFRVLCEQVSRDFPEQARQAIDSLKEETRMMVYEEKTGRVTESRLF